MVDIDNSEEIWNKGKRLLINGTSLFSRGPKVSVDGVAPKYSDSADGCYFKDVDNNPFLDYGMGVGSILLGWNYITEEIIPFLTSGTNLSLLSPHEVELAETISHNIPSCQRMKFLSSGSEVTETAVRIARAFTERDVVIRDEYHGWMSWCSPLPGGVPKCYYDLTIVQPEQDIEKYKELLDTHDVACVILEPMKSFDTTKENRSLFLNQLKNECKKHGTLLIFDEVACGYRFDIGGAQKYFNVFPDVSAFGKSVANGFPLSFVGTTEEIGNEVEDKIFISSTFGGNPLSIGACIETTKIVSEYNVPKKLGEFGKNFKDSLNKISKENDMLEYISITGLPNRLAWNCKDWDIRSLLMQEFVNRNIFFTWEIKNSFSHKEDELSYTIEKFEEIIKICKKAIKNNTVLEQIKGKPIRPIL